MQRRLRSLANGRSTTALPDLGTRMDRLEGRMDRLEGRMDRLEQRVAKIDSDLTVLKWMVGFAVALAVANLFFTWQIILRLPGIPRGRAGPAII